LNALLAAMESPGGGLRQGAEMTAPLSNGGIKNLKEIDPWIGNISTIMGLTIVSLLVVKAIIQGAPPYLAPDIAPLYRLSGLFFWGVIFFQVKERLEKYSGRYVTRWWDVNAARQDGPLDWKQVFELASLAEDRDPVIMGERGGLRNDDDFGRHYVFRFLVIMAATALAIPIDYLINPRIPGVMIRGGVSDIIQASANLTAYLALIASIATIYFAFKQLRARVRASSRQKWIDSVRRLMAGMIADIIKMEEDGVIDNRGLNRRRLHLELLLNPSEKDHRLLVFLIRAFIYPNGPIESDRHLKAQVNKALEKFPCPHGSMQLLQMINDCGVRPNQEVKRAAISYIVKLSQIVLKREWERVRHIR
jgi:hypothetical protein